MLKHFTWQQFLIAALVLSCIWYLIVALFYHEKLRGLFARKDNNLQGPLKHVWEEEYDELPDDDKDNLLGKPVLPDGMSRISMNMFGFAPDMSGKAIEEQQGLIPDVIEELKSIFHIIEKEQGTKEDFISLFGLVKAKYAPICDTPNQRALNDYIRENALFPISDDELTNLWS